LCIIFGSLKTVFLKRRGIMTENDIVAYKKLIEGEVRRFARNPKYSDLREDMISTGWLGLLDAKSRYDPGRGSLESFAKHRIRGAILDSLRGSDVISRHHRNFKMEEGKAKANLSIETGKEPDPKAVAGKLGIKMEKFWRLSSCASFKLVSIDMIGAETITDHNYEENPEKAAADAILKAKLDSMISQLTDKERMVIELYYYQEKTMKEIGAILGKTEPRISQLHTQAIKKLNLEN
jgi:RNA polymerase sigma factor for flagellar operon FliA